ncbi:hypothetical protein E2562_031902 [Oryza meyeriana var. granulata]|uniref:Uncharacterized protein n=1 Tax=Oryza meyeriana var. granulata TaxID=110450 RepID=A0A6G1D9Q5_9ORYZ|nr:hypothetical protein E2562_031902 [Oryza meyeriana var. granulata]
MAGVGEAAYDSAGGQAACLGAIAGRLKPACPNTPGVCWTGPTIAVPTKGCGGVGPVGRGRRGPGPWPGMGQSIDPLLLLLEGTGIGVAAFAAAVAAVP